jgi:serine/threonine protein kinase
MGPSLGSLRKQCTFSLKTILMLADMMVNQIKMYHDLSIIHRDIKPDNFLVDYQLPHKSVCLADFGLSKKLSSVTSESTQRVGSLRYMSRYIHDFIEATRRDDMYSLGYTLIYLFQGSLPWSIEGIEKNQRHRHLAQTKTSITNEFLTRSMTCTKCSSCTIQNAFRKYFDYLDGRKAYDEIDHGYLIDGFLLAMKSHNWICHTT